MWSIFEYILQSNKKRRSNVKTYQAYGINSEAILYPEDGAKAIFRSLIENGNLRISQPMRRKMILRLLDDAGSAEFFSQNRDKCSGWPDFALYEKKVFDKTHNAFSSVWATRGYGRQDIETFWQFHGLGVQEAQFKECARLMREKGLTANEAAVYLKKKTA